MYCYVHMCYCLHFRAFLRHPWVFPRSLGTGARRSPPEQTPQVRALVEVRGTCSGVSKSRKMASNHGEAFRARRAIQVHANPRTGRTNIRRVAHVVQNSPGGYHGLPAHLVLVLECSGSCSSAPRAHVRMLVLVLSYSCSSAFKLVRARASYVG